MSATTKFQKLTESASQLIEEHPGEFPAGLKQLHQQLVEGVKRSRDGSPEEVSEAELDALDEQIFGPLPAAKSAAATDGKPAAKSAAATDDNGGWSDPFPEA